VSATTINTSDNFDSNGVELFHYSPSRSSSEKIHPWLIDLETKVIRAEALYRKASGMKSSGYTPDVIISHPGWGESLFLKHIWPRAKIGVYCEFYYGSEGRDSNFDPEFLQNDQADVCRLDMKNINNLVHFEIADAGIAPTKWQASTFPDRFKSKITVIHDGIDTTKIRPDPLAELNFTNGVSLSKKDEIITFVNRNLEPYRGYHIFMRSLPEILKRRPNAKVLIVGGDGVSYGAPPKGGQTWKEIFAREVRPRISDNDWARVIFLGNLSYNHFLALLQISSVHVYLTYPFVLSWSLLEAMSAGCAIVASNTQPVRELIRHNDTGILVDFFDVQNLSDQVCQLLDDRPMRGKIGKNARAHIEKNYDLEKVCLPKQIKWVESLINLKPDEKKGR